MAAPFPSSYILTMSISDYLADPVLRDFVLLTEPGARALVRRGYEAALGDLAAGSGAETVGGGRAPHPVVELAGGERVVVRRYRRGGMMRHLNRERYLLGHRAFEELRVTEHAAVVGVRVPAVLAAVERRAGVFYTAALATRWIADGQELAGWIEGRDERRVGLALYEAGRQIGRMHRAGIVHPDLNLRNLLVVEDVPGPVVYILDFDRARLLGDSVAPADRARGLRRLARSARKLHAPIGGDAWEALRQGYGADWPRALR